MENEYKLLIEKEQMWAKMLIEVLEDNGISCITRSVRGAGLFVKTGIQDLLQIYVLAEHYEKATDIVEELFSKD